MKGQKREDAARKALNREKTVRIMIPAAEGTGESVVECGINGCNYIIRRGERVEVPASVAALLKRAGHI